MLQQKRFRNKCACAARAEELGAGHQKVDEEDEELAHLANTTINTSPCKTPRRGRIPSYYEFAPNTILACDFFVVVTATFRMLYVFVVIEHGTRRLAHVNVTAHPSADWTLQQLREVIGDNDDHHKYLIHDRDRIFARDLDNSIQALGVDVIRTPIASPKANWICERVIGTIRRECLDWMIPLSEAHLRTILIEWVTHYNTGRPHSALGPGVPDPPWPAAVLPKAKSRHRLAAGAFVRVKSVLRGLHHEYSLAIV